MSTPHDKHTNAPSLGGRSPPAEQLPNEVLWSDGGHASDVVLTAIADGETAIVPHAVRLHVERCATCMGHLGNAALLSLHVGEELAARATHEHALASMRRPLPRLPIALGLLVALIGLVPSLDEVGSLRVFLTHDIPLFLHGIGTLARRLFEPGSTTGLLVTYAAAVMLVAMGVAVARILPKKETSR